MPAVHSNLVFVNTRRIRGLSVAVDNDEPLRKGEAGTGGGGEPGADGDSAYTIAVANGFVGDVTAWLASLMGAPGTPGTDGEDGTNGTNGTNGTAGRDFFNRRIQTVASATGTVACDWSLYDEIRLTLVGDVTLTFSGATDGQGCTLKLKQDGTGSRTVALPGSVRYSADITGFVATTTLNKIDRIGFIRDAGDSTYDFVAAVKGLA